MELEPVFSVRWLIREDLRRLLELLLFAAILDLLTSPSLFFDLLTSSSSSFELDLSRFIAD